MVGVPPTGKKFTVQHIHWFKLKEGLIAGHRPTRDDLSMMVPLGLKGIHREFPASMRDGG